MIRRASYVHRIALARGQTRSMRVGAPFFAAVLAVLLLAGCATPPQQTTRTEITRVPTPVWLPIPNRYIEPLAVPELGEDLDNEQLEIDTQQLEDLIERYEADRASLRRIQQRRAGQ